MNDLTLTQLREERYKAEQQIRVVLVDLMKKTRLYVEAVHIGKISYGCFAGGEPQAILAEVQIELQRV